MALPRISIVTPSYNQGKFIEETIRSVLEQGYPNLEYIVIDGGSTDDSVDIIRRYEKQLAYWVSEKDSGAADAIGKGFAKATGEILAYLNSDDVYLPGALQTIGTLMTDSNIDVAFGNMYWMDTHGNRIGERRQTRFLPMGYLFGGSDLMQPSTFWRKDVYLRSGGIDPSYRFTFDADLFFRFALHGARFKFVNKFLASFRIHPRSKSSTEDTILVAEMKRIREKYLPFSHKSLRGRCVRAMTWAYRTIWYILQGDLFWLAGRIPDRLRAPWSPGIVGPKGRRV